jgi:hypothetical protein
MEIVALDVQKGPRKFESDPLVRSGTCSGRGQGTWVKLCDCVRFYCGPQGGTEAISER